MAKIIQKVPTFTPGDPVCDALFSGKRAERAKLKDFKEGPIETLPGIFSNDPRLLEFKDKLSLKLTDLLPESVDEYGRVTGSGVRSNFLGMRHVNGFMMDPATYPIVDNTLLREEAGLANDFVEPWHRNLFRAIVKLFFSNLEPVPLKLRKGSSSVCPFFVNQLVQKMDLARFALLRAEEGGNMMLKGDFETPFLKFFFGGASYVVYRAQSSDAIVLLKNGKFQAKARNVADLEYALTGGASGRFFASSKEMGNVDFSVPNGFFRERKRTAHGVGFSTNVVLMVVAQAVRKKLYDVYKYSFHHTTRMAQQEDVRKWHSVIAADVMQHDQYYPMFFADEMADVLLEMGFAEWWVEFFKLKGKLPYYVTDVSPGEGNILLGDWRNPSSRGGLTSGEAFTDIMGTVNMGFNYLITQISHVFPKLAARCKTEEGALEVAHSYFQGRQPIVQKSKSDDALLGVTDYSLVPAANRLQEKMKAEENVNPYMRLSLEHGGAFLGSILLTPTDGSLDKTTFIGNVISLTINQFSPEYGVQSKIRDRSRVKRPFPGLAWETLPSVYGTAPAFGVVMEETERAWREAFGFSYSIFREEMLREDKRRLTEYIAASTDASLKIDEMTSIDHEVIASPEKLQYKFSSSDVSPGVEDMLFNGLPLEEVVPLFQSITRSVK